MTWDNCLVTVVSQNFKPDEKEAIYGTPFRARSFTPEQARAWNNPGHIDANLMPRNEYIPSPRVGKKGKGTSPFPAKLDDVTDGADLYWSTTKKYSKPKSAATFLLQSPAFYDSPSKAAAARVWVAAVERSMQEFSYPLRLAGYGFSVEAVPRGVEFTVSGWTERLPRVWKDSLAEFLALDLDEGTFVDLKDEARHSQSRRAEPQSCYSSPLTCRLAVRAPRSTHRRLEGASRAWTKTSRTPRPGTTAPSCEPRRSLPMGESGSSPLFRAWRSGTSRTTSSARGGLGLWCRVV